jgi:hypothetical protein
MRLTKIELLISSDYDNALDTIISLLEEQAEVSVIDYRDTEVTMKGWN